MSVTMEYCSVQLHAQLDQQMMSAHHIGDKSGFANQCVLGNLSLRHDISRTQAMKQAQSHGEVVSKQCLPCCSSDSSSITKDSLKTELALANTTLCACHVLSSVTTDISVNSDR